MSAQSFGDFVLDPAQRRLLRAGESVALNARYFDALVLLVREPGQLIAKQRFFDEVWRGSVVTDAALTQCIKEIRRALGDDAGSPRFVRTVAGHGYCFIAVVSAVSADAAPAAAPVQPAGAAPGLPTWLTDTVAAASGGAVSGLAGGLLYGSILASSAQAQGQGSLSVLLVLLALSMLVGVAGAGGVGLGFALARQLGRGTGWTLGGAALGGLVVGGLSKLLGSDAFTLLVGHAPAGTTGGLEGAVIGLALAGGLWLGGGPEAAQPRRPIAFAAVSTGLAGALLPLVGGSLMASSLARVAASFGQSRLDMAPLARLFGDPQLGLPAQASLGALEGALFGACVAGALVLVRRRPA